MSGAIKTFTKQAGKWVIIFIIVTIYMFLLGYALKEYLIYSGIIENREYEYVDGESQTKYTPKDLNKFIKNIDRFVEDIKTTKGG